MALNEQRSKQLLEPTIDPKTKRMDVGGFKIPPTSLITALLYGFGNHEVIAAREYYFWRICDELWNREDLPEKLKSMDEKMDWMEAFLIKNYSEF